ncbi:GAF domain-containing protein [Flavicella sediminum]|uniref:GAF domain-containing protein n=1 Tax=Flavicella sediminum TaxID=2585141 RepID=UPI00111EF0CE|nr:GAF domain-containing protein [Flavicella sediminum]
MKIINSPYRNNILPIQIKISFEKIYEFLENKASNKNNFFQDTAVQALNEFNKYPVLREGFTDLNLLETYSEQIGHLLEILFPELLQSNEIKAASIPFNFTTFKLSNRFRKIIEDAGDDYVLSVRDFEEDKMYILACTFIVAYYYNFTLDFKRPIFYDIPNKKTGEVKHYRTTFNGDFFEIIKTETAPPISEEAIISLLDNFDNIEKWKELFPPNSYILKGFGLTNLFDVTQDEMISNLKANLLKKDANAILGVRDNLATIYNIPNLKFGFTMYDSESKKLKATEKYAMASLSMVANTQRICADYFCESVLQKVFTDKKILAISDVEKYGVATNENEFYRSLHKKNIQSIILIPLVSNDCLYGIMELGSDKKHELNSINAYKLKDIVPVFTMASQRAMEERQLKLESIIQENYTTIHPTVKWRFIEAAENYLDTFKEDKKSLNLEEIVFDEVYPLFGQCDIKGSSIARNKAIQEDVTIQLKSVITLVNKALETENLPIYNELIFRTENYLDAIKMGLKTGDEQTIIKFLSQEVTPVFLHLKKNEFLKPSVVEYESRINEKLQIVYEKRKEYEDYVTLLNDRLATHIDAGQIEAQKMFPHYFERYKTDGVEFNMYIGQSLVKDKDFDELYLQNLRLWQLKLICELEHIVHDLEGESNYSLDIASLILVHSSSLAIKFRMDEKQFDVDGAYNIRYEIIKKRIDKAHIKNTTERVTQPYKIAIIYTQNSDKQEYLRYIAYLQSKGFLQEGVEDVELEDLQGISGLKALRVPVNYNTPKENISFEELMKVIKE